MASTSTMVQIPFWIQPHHLFPSQKTQNNPHALTTQWTSIPKRGISTIPVSSPQNVCLVFTSEKLASSLQATTLSIPVIHGSLVMDTERLHSNIPSQLWDDPISAATPWQLVRPLVDPWPWWFTTPPQTHLFYKSQSQTPCSSVLTWPFPAGHFSQTKTLHKSACITIGPDSWFYIKDYCKLCTICPHAKPVCHKPYGLLKHTNPWNSNSMDS